MKPSERIKEIVIKSPSKFKESGVWICAILDYLDEQYEDKKYNKGGLLP